MKKFVVVVENLRTGEKGQKAFNTYEEAHRFKMFMNEHHGMEASIEVRG